MTIVSRVEVLCYKYFLPCHQNFSLLRSKHLPQSVTLTLSFKIPTPTIQHLLKLGRSSEKPENEFKLLEKILMELLSSKKMFYRPHTRYISIHDQKCSNHVYSYLF